MWDPSYRASIRSKKKDGKRVMVTNQKVRKWEKKWVTIADTTLRVYKWVPVAEKAKDEKCGPDLTPPKSNCSPGMKDMQDGAPQCNKLKGDCSQHNSEEI